MVYAMSGNVNTKNIEQVVQNVFDELIFICPQRCSKMSTMRLFASVSCAKINSFLLHLIFNEIVTIQ